MTSEPQAIAQEKASRIAIGNSRVRWAFVAALIAALALSFAAAGANVLPGDVAVALFVQAWPSVLDPLYAFTNWLGTGSAAIGLALIAATALALRRRFHEASLLLFVPLAWVINISLKRLIESPRPTADLVEVTHVTGGFGFPSGHVMGVTVLAAFTVATIGRLCGRRARAAAVVAAIILVAVTGLARIDNGAHWPSDVLGGWLWGAIVAAALLNFHAAVVERLARR